ncbi:MAG: endonuclease III [Bacillota bacterium]|jgi:endonuclease-3|nr:endonuclease III [Eubacteriales bacterium]MDD3537001.1 endonuclease III [Eubacteriales bacterium]MDD4286129.1 endonuclease III [Eubacteriales bacterium]MDI9491544.1 endonuclease III [Bacillota bacterium]NLV69297.1 endonuclease III [Clostridiales bacterium]
MSVLPKAGRETVIKQLLLAYPDAGCALHFHSVFQLLVSVVLSAQTTDKSVNEVTPALFERAPDAHAMAELPEEEIRERIRRIGMYRTKAANLSRLSRLLVEKYDGNVPGEYDRLIELPGVGRKTANVVLSVAFGRQRIAVDTHVFRLANRIGLANETDVLKTELALMEAIPEERWTAMHHALIYHGRQVCSARKPRCEECCIRETCLRNGV